MRFFNLFVFTVAIFFSQSMAARQLQLPKSEFRAAWVATVKNMDWPSKPGLPIGTQKAEAIALLDRAVFLKLNVIIFQVRPHCDAFYKSSYEPWSYFLTGQQGKNPGYDPLQFWITEAHKRGLELHAWFNPFRVRHPSMKGTYSEKSILRRRPHWGYELKKGYAWLDPGRKEVRKYSTDVIMEVVKRYDIDGVHLDDYFYPYPEFTRNGFPDSQTYNTYKKSGGTLKLSDWRRENINIFVKELSAQIKPSKIRFGISPFGIWRPNFPVGVKGLDAYEVIYADSRKWLQKGWVDYLAPQLYWSTYSTGQSFEKLLDWWRAQNIAGVDIFPGLAIYKINSFKGGHLEIIKQLKLIEQRVDVRGFVYFNLKPLLKSDTISKPLSNALRADVLVPPLKGSVFNVKAENVRVSHKVLLWSCPSRKVRRWLLYVGNRTYIIPGKSITFKLDKLPRGTIHLVPIGPSGVPGRAVSVNH